MKGPACELCGYVMGEMLKERVRRDAGMNLSLTSQKPPLREQCKYLRIEMRLVEFESSLEVLEIYKNVRVTLSS